MIRATVTPTAKTNIDITIILKPSVSEFRPQQDPDLKCGTCHFNRTVNGEFSVEF